MVRCVAGKGARHPGDPLRVHRGREVITLLLLRRGRRRRRWRRSGPVVVTTISHGYARRSTPPREGYAAPAGWRDMRRPRRWASEAARLSDAEGYAAAVSLSREADMPRVTRGILRLQPGEYANALFLPADARDIRRSGRAREGLRLCNSRSRGGTNGGDGEHPLPSVKLYAVALQSDAPRRRTLGSG